MKPLIASILLCASLFADAHIFCYHRFDDPKPNYKHTNISSAKFKEQLTLLKKEGYKFASLSSVISSVKAKKTIQDKIAVITIDDAYRSFYEKAFPILKEQKIPFTLFVYTKAIDEGYRDYMNWNEIKEISKYGEAQLHSNAHKDLTKLTKEELAEDTKKATESFFKNLGHKPTKYAYPFGLYNLEVKNHLKSAGFEAILTVDGGAVNEGSDIFQLERIAVSGETDFKTAIGVKPLDISITGVSGTNPKNIKATVKNYGGNEIKMYLAKGNVKTVKLSGGAFETDIDMGSINSKKKLIFYTGDHRYRAKLIEKDEK